MRLTHVLAPLLVPALVGISAPPATPSTQIHSHEPDAYVIDLLSAPTVDELDEESAEPEELADETLGNDNPQSPEGDTSRNESPQVTPQDDSEDRIPDVADEDTTPSVTPQTDIEPEPIDTVEPTEPIGDIVVDENGAALTDNVSFATQANLDTEHFDLISAPLDTEVFNVAAVTWTGSTPASIEIRTLTSGTWSEWYGLELETDDGASGTEPFISGGADGVQVRSVFAAEPAEFELVLLTGSGTQREVYEDDPEVTEELPAEGSDVEAAVNNVSTTDMMDGVVNNAIYSVDANDTTISDISFTMQRNEPRNVAPPAMVTRALWGAPAKARWSPESAKLEGAVIHHTAGNNVYTREQAPSIVSGIRYYHDVTLGWGDIGYNFLVDKYGTIYEGREGSAASADGQMVVGGHARPANTNTVGISILGNYTSVQPSTESINAVADIIAWQFGRAGISVWGTWNHYSLGRLNTIVGHNQVAMTACPALISGHFGTIRNRAAATISAASTGPITAPVAPITTHGEITSGRNYATVRDSAIRVSPYPKATALRSLPTGQPVVTGSRSVRNNYGPWWQVSQNGVTGWVRYSDLIGMTRHPLYSEGHPEQFWVSEFTYSFSSPSRNVQRASSFGLGDYVTSTGTSFGDFHEVSIGGQSSWVLKARLSSDLPAALAGSIQGDREYSVPRQTILYMQPLSNSNQIRTLAPNTMLLTGTRSARIQGTAWWEVRLGDQVGWVHYRDLIASTSSISYRRNGSEVTREIAANATLFSTASQYSSRLSSLWAGQTVVATGEQYGYYSKIRSGSLVGWIPTASLR